VQQGNAHEHGRLLRVVWRQMSRQVHCIMKDADDLDDRRTLLVFHTKYDEVAGASPATAEVESEQSAAAFGAR